MTAARYQIVVVRFGSRRSARSDVFLNTALMGGGEGEIDMDYSFWIIRGGDRVILVDTGFAADVGRRRGRTLHADPLDLARRLGAGPEDAPLVLATHAHYDHIGNLRSYTGSEIRIARAELEFWTDPISERGEFAALTEPVEVDALRSADRQGRVHPLDDGDEIAPGIVAHVVGGHTPGQLMLEVPTASGPVLLTSDVIHYEEELETDVPFTHIADLPSVYRAFDRVRRLRDRGALIIPGHDPATLTRIGAPLDGLAGLTATIGIGAQPERTTP